jgi:hypothetical protein
MSEAARRRARFLLKRTGHDEVTVDEVGLRLYLGDWITQETGANAFNVVRLPERAKD